VVADTGSTNGTFINGQRIAYGRAFPINEGDKVKFGNIEVYLRRVPKPTDFATQESYVAEQMPPTEAFKLPAQPTQVGLPTEAYQAAQIQPDVISAQPQAEEVQKIPDYKFTEVEIANIENHLDEEEILNKRAISIPQQPEDKIHQTEPRIKLNFDE
jgi:pSer/pThr/pTyr-binding forkhead associated (FHA) protein